MWAKDTPATPDKPNIVNALNQWFRTLGRYIYQGRGVYEVESRESFMENSIIMEKKNKKFVSKFRQNDREKM
jgi:hypothetical protein